MSNRRNYWHAGKPMAETAIRSHFEVAELMTARGFPMCKQRVCELGRRALWKLRAALADLACDFAVEETPGPRRKKANATAGAGS